MKKVTLQMIAEKLSVSKALVSKALSNDPAVSDVTKEAIWQTAEELGYRIKTTRKPSTSARTGNLAVLMPRAYLDDLEYWGKVIQGIEKELIEHGFSMILSSIDISLPSVEGLPASIHDRKADGAIVMGHLPESYISALQTRGVPFVMVDASQLDPAYDHVLANNFLGSYQAAKHLLEEGHRRLAFVGDVHTSWSFRERLRGCEEAVRDYNAAAQGDHASCVVIEGVGVSGKGMYTAPAFADHLRQALLGAGQPVTGLLCANDLTAFEVLKVLPELQLSCPQDVSIVGYDDLALTEMMQPHLTTVRVPTGAIGSRAAQRLLRRIDYPHETNDHILLTTKLVKRSSVRNIAVLEEARQ